MFFIVWFLPHDAMQSMILLRQIIHLSISLWHWGVVDTLWNISKIISRLISLGLLLSAHPNITDLLLISSCKKLELRLSALMDSDLAWVNDNSGR